MSTENLKHKRVRHFNIPGHAHLLTFCCYHRMRLLTNDPWRQMFSQSIDAALQRHRFQLIAFVYMPEHAHLLVWPLAAEYGMDELLYAIKRPFSYRIKVLLAEARSPLLAQLTVRERPGKMAFRFWQEGPGHDRNLISLDHCMKAAEYIHNNPVRRGLCDNPRQWRWSSWHHYYCPGQPLDPLLPIVHGFPS